VRGAQVIDERKIIIEGQEAVQVTVGTAMYGQNGLSRMLLRPSPAEPAPAAPEPPLPRIELLAPNIPAPDAPVVEGNYTGLIIDARGLKVQPAMAPRILKADGTPIYGVGNFDLDKVVEQGLASYYRDMDAARADKRAGNNPLIVRPIGVYRRAVATTDVVLSDADTAKLLAEDAKTRFLRQLKVGVRGGLISAYAVDFRHAQPCVRGNSPRLPRILCRCACIALRESHTWQRCAYCIHDGGATMQRVETLDELLVAEPSVLTPPTPAEVQDETENLRVLTHAVERIWRQAHEEVEREREQQRRTAERARFNLD
jgi:hypothetical protein